MSRTNVVVLSGDFKLKMAVSNTLRKDPGIHVDIMCHTIDSAQASFIKNTPNVLVLDIDTHNAERRFLKALME